MAVYYNTRVITSNLVYYFDSLNPASYSSSNLTSLVSSYTYNTSLLTNDGGFLYASGIKTSPISYTPSGNAVSFVLSLKLSDTSSGTMLALTDNNPYVVYVNTAIAVSNTVNSRTNSTSSIALGNLVSNTAIALSNNILIRVNATANLVISNIVSNTSIAVFESGNNRSNAITTILLGNTVSDSENTVANNVPLTINAVKDTYLDRFNTISGISFDPGYIKVIHMNGDYQLYTANRYSNNLNDIVTVVFKTNSTDSGIRVYLNRSLIAETANNANIVSFGTNLSITNLNALGDPTDTPFRSVLVYDRELTSEEVAQITSAIKRDQ